MPDSDVALVPYTSDKRAVTELAEAVMRCLCAAPGSVRVNFPQVFLRYSSPRKARQSVVGVRNAMLAGPGFGAYTIEIAEQVVGVASYQQRAYKVPLAGGLLANVDGPLIAAWLAIPEVCERPRHMLPTLLASGAQILSRDRALTGTPWTVVNVHNVYVAKALTETEVLGGFAAVGESGTFADLDGSNATRQVYVSGCTLQELREADR